MAIEKHNPRKSTKYPGKFNQRENKASTSNFSALELSAAETDYQLASDDSFNFVKFSDAAATQNCFLPKVAESKGRCITFFSDGSLNADTATKHPDDTTNIVEGDDEFTLDGAGEWVELFCTGSKWIAVRGTFTVPT